jgi:Acyl-CoA carboxylase epsilon subunit
MLSVVRGDPTPAELAAVVVVLAARAGQGAAGRPATRRPRSQWAVGDRLMRPVLAVGPGAWRASGLPH